MAQGSSFSSYVADREVPKIRPINHTSEAASRKIRQVLLCGHRSFAAQGLGKLLEAAGHKVVAFSRGSQNRAADIVTGQVEKMCKNPHLNDSFDTVINYIILKQSPIEANVEYVAALLRFCKEKTVKHLIHISSISTYEAAARLINEDAPVESDPLRKGPYGALKVAAERHIREHVVPGLKISFVRPGFILGAGRVDPIFGIGMRLPWNQLLALGNARNHLPVISRDLLNQAIVELVAHPPEGSVESLLLADKDSPTRKEYLKACNQLLGVGVKTRCFPVSLWLMAGLAGEVVGRLTGNKSLKVFAKIRDACRFQQVDSTRTESRLGMSLRMDWRKHLLESLDGQSPNFTVPTLPKTARSLTTRRVAYIGFGRIVKQKHLPALRTIKFAGSIDAYDLQSRQDENGQSIRCLTEIDLKGTDLVVVASPGPAHTEALAFLGGCHATVVVEKPLAYGLAELERWLQFAAGRPARVIVCHNYRYKQNVLATLAHLRSYNPGKLLHVTLAFQSPSVVNDPAAWMHHERAARTLLLDYSLHFMDIACMFGQGEWRTETLRYQRDANGHTSLIEGNVKCDNYSVNFLLRQGFCPRRARLSLMFQNYTVSLGFFPDTFVPHMAPDNYWLYKMESTASLRGVLRKIADRALNKDSDESHAWVYRLAMQPEHAAADGLTVGSLASFYRLMYAISEEVYGA